MGEHVLDRLVLVVAEAVEHHEPRLLLGRGQQQLGDDLVGAAEVEQLDVGEVEQGGERSRSAASAASMRSRTAAPVGRVTRLR